MDIMRGWGGPQLIAGPVLMIPATVVTNDSYSRRVTDTRLNVLPETLDIEVDLEAQLLYRGIHEVPFYLAKARITGVLRAPEEEAGGAALEALHRQNAFVALALTAAGTTRSCSAIPGAPA